MRTPDLTGHLFPPVYVILDAPLLPLSEVVLAKSLARAGVRLFQYRNKQVSSRRLLEIARALGAELGACGARLILNDRPDIAAIAGAEGAHVGQEDLSPAAARAICGSPLWVGVSTHMLEQVRTADAAPVDYIAVGPVFATTTKERPDPLVGVEFIREARELTGKPLVAIGGITLERARELYAAGAASLAVARDILCARDPFDRAGEYLRVAADFFRF